jgi:hypothetical protein
MIRLFAVRKRYGVPDLPQDHVDRDDPRAAYTNTRSILPRMESAVPPAPIRLHGDPLP